MTATIYLIRHGETTWNRAGRLQGQADAPLTLHGTRQIRAIGAALREVLTHEGVDAGNGGLVMHASTLGRARQSAAIVAELIGHDYDAIRFDPRLVEITLGIHDGFPGWSAIDKAFPGLAEKRRADPWNFAHPSGESSQMVQDRVRPWLDELAAEGGVHLAVSHGVTLKILRGLYLGLTREETFALDRPQEAFHRMSGGRIDLFEVEVP